MLQLFLIAFRNLGTHRRRTLLLGGAIAVILVGPWVGALCVSTVLIVQCLLFADGGLTALGLNITNMALLHLNTAGTCMDVRGMATGRSAASFADHEVRAMNVQVDASSPKPLKQFGSLLPASPTLAQTP